MAPDVNPAAPHFSQIQRALGQVNADLSVVDTERLPEPIVDSLD